MATDAHPRRCSQRSQASWHRHIGTRAAATSAARGRYSALAEALQHACSFQQVTCVANAMPALENFSTILEGWLPDGIDAPM